MKMKMMMMIWVAVIYTSSHFGQYLRWWWSGTHMVEGSPSLRKKTFPTGRLLRGESDYNFEARLGDLGQCRLAHAGHPVMPPGSRDKRCCTSQEKHGST